MVKGLYTAYTGMLNQQNRMDVLTNNLANSATVGFKKEGATTQAFDDVLWRSFRGDEAVPDDRFETLDAAFGEGRHVGKLCSAFG